MYEEGICIPPVKLFQRGAPNKFVFELIEANVRFRELVIGDIYSNVAACNVGYQSFSDLLAEYDIEDSYRLPTASSRLPGRHRQVARRGPERRVPRQPAGRGGR